MESVSILLETKDLSIAFGGHVAVSDVNFSLEPFMFKSIIGPNGAGKTTFFNLLSGQLRPTTGQVYYKGTDITKLSPSARTKLGIGRSFQITNVFPNLSVLENVRLAVQSQAGVMFNMFKHYRSYRTFEDKAYYLLEQVLLTNKAHEFARNLAHGEKRKLEIAMLLALDSQLLLLDEPTAGMSLEEVPAILDVIRTIRDKRDRTILLIEHKMDMVLDLSDQVAVLFNGKLLADGSPQNIMNNEQVQLAYLGGLHDEYAS